MDKPHGINSAGDASEPPDDSAVGSGGDVESVGYKRPPTRTQFKKRQSGNTKGRPKGSENLSKLLEEVLAERISVSQGGKAKRMSKAEALVQLTLNRAINGNTRAIDGMLILADKIGRFKQPSEDGQNRPGVVIVPEQCETQEEWERLYGAAARGENHRQADSQPRRAKVTRPFTIEAVDQLVQQGKIDVALGCYRWHLARYQAILARDASNSKAQDDVQLVVNRIGSIGFRYICSSQFAKAVDVFEQVIELAPTVMHGPRLYAYALMLHGDAHQAREIYLRYRDDAIWKAEVLKDFASGRGIGHTHPLMEEIEKLFATADNVHAD